MANDPPTEGPTPDDVQYEMQGTREHLGGQVQALGDKLMGMAHDANAAVAGALQDGKDAAHAIQDAVQHAGTDAVAYAKRALDVRGHVRRYPWAAVGIAVALGFACGRLTGRR